MTPWRSSCFVVVLFSRYDFLDCFQRYGFLTSTSKLLRKNPMGCHAVRQRPTHKAKQFCRCISESRKRFKHSHLQKYALKIGVFSSGFPIQVGNSLQVNFNFGDILKDQRAIGLIKNHISCHIENLDTWKSLKTPMLSNLSPNITSFPQISPLSSMVRSRLFTRIFTWKTLRIFASWASQWSL